MFANFKEWLIARASNYLPATLWRDPSVDTSIIGVAIVSVVMALLVLAVSAWRWRRANEGPPRHCGERGSFSGAHGPQAIAVMRELAGNTSLVTELMARFVEQDARRSRGFDRHKDQIKTALHGHVVQMTAASKSGMQIRVPR
jgi:hypothetical protein